MPSYLIHFEIVAATTEEEKLARRRLERLGFSNLVSGSNKLSYRLPDCVYYYVTDLTIGQVLDACKRIGFAQRKAYRLLVTESSALSWVGLEMLGRDSSRATVPIEEVEVLASIKELAEDDQILLATSSVANA